MIRSRLRQKVSIGSFHYPVTDDRFRGYLLIIHRLRRCFYGYSLVKNLDNNNETGPIFPMGGVGPPVPTPICVAICGKKGYLRLGQRPEASRPFFIF